MATLKAASYTNIQLFQSSDLNGLTNTSYALGSGSGVSSNVFDNTSNLYVAASALVSLGSFTPASPFLCGLFVMWSPDGTYYADPQTAVAPPAATPFYAGNCTSGAGAKLIVIPYIPLLPLKGRFLFYNNLGGTLAASANSITLTPTGFTVA